MMAGKLENLGKTEIAFFIEKYELKDHKQYWNLNMTSVGVYNIF